MYSTMQAPSPPASILSIRWPSYCSLRRWDPLHFCRSSSWVKIRQRCRFLLPMNDGPPAQDRVSMKLLALAGAPVRWNLDDVERLSRGRPSKSKMGSRAVPHRLNAEERKEFELAKKRGYLVQHTCSRRYPLINTYRNYCDALSLPSIRIEQGPAGSADQIVIDLSPLHLSEAGLFTLKDEILKAITSMALTHGDQTTPAEIAPGKDEESVQVRDKDDFPPLNTREGFTLNKLLDEPLQESILSDSLEGISQPLRFQVSNRRMTKLFSQSALDTWRSMSSKVN